MAKTQGRGRPKKTLTTKSGRPVSIKSDKKKNDEAKSKTVKQTKWFSKKKIYSEKAKRNYSIINFVLIIAIVVLVVLIYKENRDLKVDMNWIYDQDSQQEVNNNTNGNLDGNENIDIDNENLDENIDSDNVTETEENENNGENNTDLVDESIDSDNENLDENLDENGGNINIGDVNEDLVVENQGNENLENDDLSKIITDFYNDINSWDFENISSYFDDYFRTSGVALTYYNQNWLSRFVDSLVNNTIYVTDLHFMENPKETTAKYWFTLKYKLNNEDTMFEENWEIILTNIDSNPKIGSMSCTNDWCSKMPFFNPGLYE